MRLYKLLPASENKGLPSGTKGVLLHRLLPASREKKGRIHCFLLQPAKRLPSLTLLLPASGNNCFFLCNLGVIKFQIDVSHFHDKENGSKYVFANELPNSS